MPSKTAVSTLVFLGALAWLVLLMWGGQVVSESFFTPFSKVVSFLLVILAGFDRWAWKWRILPRSLVKRPDISGTWSVTLRSSWVDPNTGNVIDEIRAYLVVKQTFTSIDLRLLTTESTSRQLAAQLVRLDDDEFSLAAVYRNEPKLVIRHRSAIHFGALVLPIPNPVPDTLVGEYWTDRRPTPTSGELIATRRTRKRFADYQTSEAFFVQRQPASLR